MRSLSMALVMFALLSTMTLAQNHREPKPDPCAGPDGTSLCDDFSAYTLDPNWLQAEAMKSWDVDGDKPFLPPDYKFGAGDYVLSADGIVYLIDENRADEVQRGHDETQRKKAYAREMIADVLSHGSFNTVPVTTADCVDMFRAWDVANQATFDAGLYADSPRQDEFYRVMDIGVKATDVYYGCLRYVQGLLPPLECPTPEIPGEGVFLFDGNVWYPVDMIDGGAVIECGIDKGYAWPCEGDWDNDD